MDLRVHEANGTHAGCGSGLSGESEIHVSAGGAQGAGPQHAGAVPFACIAQRDRRGSAATGGGAADRGRFHRHGKRVHRRDEDRGEREQVHVCLEEGHREAAGEAECEGGGAAARAAGKSGDKVPSGRRDRRPAPEEDPQEAVRAEAGGGDRIRPRQRQAQDAHPAGH